MSLNIDKAMHQTIAAFQKKSEFLEKELLLTKV